MRRVKKYKGFLLMECLIGVVILAVVGAFILPAFQNMWLNHVRSERKVALLFHSENIAENLLALYNVETSPVPDLKYHDLDMVSLLEDLKKSKNGEILHRTMTVHEEEFLLDIQVVEKQEFGIRCLSEIRLLNTSEELELEFMLSLVGR